MCFYIRSSQGEISIEHASEFIRMKRLSSVIVASLLIRNESAAPIETLEITYPRSFRESRTAEFEDISQELLTPESEVNILHDAMGEAFTLGVPGTRLVTLASAGRKLLGLVLLENAIDILPSLKAKERDILYKCGLTVFELKLERSVQPQEQIWVRVKFRPAYTIRNPEPPTRRFVNWLLNETQLLYGAVGPQTVRADAGKALRGVADPVDAIYDPVDAVYATQLIERLGYIGTPTRIRDWRVSVLSKNLTLNNVVHDGDILVPGPLPSLLRPQGGQHPVWVYRWVSGSDHIAEPKTGGLFSINFTVRPVNYTVKLLPWVAVAIAAGTLAWKIFGSP